MEMDGMSTMTTQTIIKTTVVGVTLNGLLIVKSIHGFYLVHRNWFVAYGETAR
jgi:hypothetical protein